MKGTLSASKPSVVVLIGLQPLVREGRQHVKRDQRQESIQQETPDRRRPRRRESEICVPRQLVL